MLEAKSLGSIHTCRVQPLNPHTGCQVMYLVPVRKALLVTPDITVRLLNSLLIVSLQGEVYIVEVRGGGL